VRVTKASKGSAEKAAESVLCLKSCFGISQLFHKGFLFGSGETPSRREVIRSGLGGGGALAGEAAGASGERTPGRSARTSRVQSITPAKLHPRANPGWRGVESAGGRERFAGAQPSPRANER